jgi:hypothetical protein
MSCDARYIGRLPAGFEQRRTDRMPHFEILNEDRHTSRWASDIGPHWRPEAFTTWSGYELLWKNIMHWLAGGRP